MKILNSERKDLSRETERILLLEEALVEYVERYGLSEKARSALVNSPSQGKHSSNQISSDTSHPT